jgi:sugar lactone lactonase YvrE
MILAEPLGVIPVANMLGEGVLWNPADGAFWWTDIQSRRLYRHHLASGETTHVETLERLCSFALAGDRLLAAFETGLAWFDPRTAAVERLVEITPAGSGRRLNDGRTDRQGRFWVGSMCEDAPEGAAALHRFSRGALTRQREGVTISNGLCWSPDGRILYFADSPRQAITAFDFNTETGDLGPCRPFATTSGDAYPDGATVDAEGCMWSAQWGGGQVVRYDPQGRIVGTLAVPATQVTCLAFGGPDLDILCITTARDGLSPADLDRQPQAGHAFLYRACVAGLEEVSYSAH